MFYLFTYLFVCLCWLALPFPASFSGFSSTLAPDERVWAGVRVFALCVVALSVCLCLCTDTTENKIIFVRIRGYLFSVYSQCMSKQMQVHATRSAFRMNQTKRKDPNSQKFLANVSFYCLPSNGFAQYFCCMCVCGCFICVSRCRLLILSVFRQVNCAERILFCG